MTVPKFKIHNCPKCGIYGKHFWHHVFGGALKKKSEKYGAIIYWCYPCHNLNDDAIHKNAELSNKLKREHQARIMKEQGWTLEDWRTNFDKKSWL